MLSGDPQEVQSDIHQSFERACNRLITDITKTVRYYGAQKQSSDIQKILVCGGFGLFRELVRLLDNQLPMEVKLWNPFEKMRCQVGRNHRGVLVKSIIRKNGPAMAVAATLARGETRLVNVPQARLKETDRIAVMASELTRMGAQIEELEDGLVIQGGKLSGAELSGHDDHRVVMALAVAGLAAEGETVIDTAESAAVTFPNFVELMTSVGANMRTDE